MEIAENQIEKLVKLTNEIVFSITMITNIVEQLVTDVEQLKKQKNG